MSVGHHSKSAIDGLMLLHLPLLACVLGVLVFSGLTWIIAAHFILAYTVLLCAFFTVARSWHDWANPLSLILLIGFTRFSIPGLLILVGVEPDISLFNIMGL